MTVALAHGKGARFPETALQGIAHVANPELGAKQVCPNCQAKFYDLNRRPAHCPKCGTDFDPDEAVRTRRVRGRPAGVPEPEADDEDREDQVKARAADDEDEDEEVDAPEIDEEVDDVGVSDDDEDEDLEPAERTSKKKAAPDDDLGDFTDDEEIEDDEDVPFLEEDEDDDFDESEIDGIVEDDED